MKKIYKGMMALVLSAVMIISMSVTSFASQEISNEEVMLDGTKYTVSTSFSGVTTVVDENNEGTAFLMKIRGCL